ncbi:MAG: UDP-N-acetylmuramoyl-tripeptide--D-alanyl-D-alanine ligase [Chloroflexi bacterium]|nr:UDP-N-acetylmuramoyl-tripeptide--D-alanyl-D-alanine ligase [Chloroflexota bacterium]
MRIAVRDLLRGIQHPDNRQEPPLPAHIAISHITDVAIDSRLVQPGGVFVALVGARADGHDYLASVAAQGGVIALVDQTRAADLAAQHGWTAVFAPYAVPAQWQGVLLVGVDHPLHALQRWAAWHRQQHQLSWVVGITGSVGKTSTKEMIAALLSRFVPTHKTPRSYNSESTLPLVALGIEAQHHAVVFEMGMYAAGEIALLAQIAAPNIAVITTVGPSHLERMGSIEAIAQAKSELVQALSVDGVAVLNADDERVRAMAHLTQARVITYGLDADADMRAVDVEQLGLLGTRFKVVSQQYNGTIHLASPGLHQVRNLLAALAVCQVVGVPFDVLQQAIAHDIAQVRFVVYQGTGNVQIIDDTYNAAPTSMQAALELLATVKTRRVAVLGDMRELGHIEEEAHRTIGRVAHTAADVLVAVGSRGEWIGAEAERLGMRHVVYAPDTERAIPIVQQIIQPGDCVLIKGSRAMHMEDIVSAIRMDAV